MGTVQRSVSTLVQKRSGPPAWIDSVLAESSELRKKSVQPFWVKVASVADAENRRSEPQFFSGNMVSLSSTLAAVSAERIEVRTEGNNERQTVIYEWAQ